MQLSLDFDPRPHLTGEVAAFPLARTAFVARVAADMAAIEAADERDRHWLAVCRRLALARFSDGLTDPQVEADLAGFQVAVGAALRSLPPRREAEVIDFDHARWERAHPDNASRKEIA